MSRIKGALFFSFVTQQLNLLISLITIAIIARLLTPAEIGVFAVTNVLIVLATEIRSFGVTQYLVREPKLSQETIRNALGIMLVSCWFLAIATVFAAPFVADFYAEPDIEQMLWILSVTFLIAPFASVPYSMMIRDVRFDLIFRIKILSSLARACTSVALVIAGYSYFGLVWGILVGSVVELAAITYYDKSRSLCIPSLSQWRSIIGFGAVTSSAGLLQRLSQSLPDLVLGKLSTMSNVGYFSRGLGMLNFLDQLVSKAVRPIILPYLSGINRADGDVGTAYLRCVVLHGAISIPAFAVAGVVSLPLIRVFFGDQWDVAAPIASVLSIWAIFQTTHSFLPDALIATGNEKSLLKKEAAVAMLRFLLLVFSAQYGLMAVAISIAFSGFLEFVICSYIAANRLDLRFLMVLKALSANLITAMVCYFAAKLCLFYIGSSMSSLSTLLLVGVVTFPVWIFTLKLLKHELWSILQDVFIGLVFKLTRI